MPCASAIKAGLAYAPPIRYGALRALIAASALLVLSPLTGRPFLPPRRLWVGVIVLAASGTLLAYAAMFSAPGRTGAGIASVLGNTAPLLTLVLAVPLLGERLNTSKTSALLLGLGGATLIAYPALTDPSHHGPVAGLLPLVAAAGFAISSVVVKRIDAREAELQVAAWQLLLGGGALIGVSAILEPGQTIHWRVPFVALLVFLAVIGTALTTVVWYWLVQRDDVGRLSISLFFVPVVGLGLAMTLFGETLDLIQVVGIGLILSALAVLILARTREGGAVRGTG